MTSLSALPEGERVKRNKVNKSILYLVTGLVVVAVVTVWNESAFLENDIIPVDVTGPADTTNDLATVHVTAVKPSPETQHSPIPTPPPTPSSPSSSDSVNPPILTKNPSTADSYKNGSSCSNLCAGPLFSPTTGGFPPVAFSSSPLIASFVCASTFRDMCDYVYSWPFEHYSEKVWSERGIDNAGIAKCLPPVPIIYFHPNPKLASGLARLLDALTTPAIIVSGGNDFSVPTSKPEWGQIFTHRNLGRWFGQNSDLRDTANSKFASIPIGLNCFSHGPGTEAFLESRKVAPPVTVAERRTFLVNFSLGTNPSRVAIHKQFCETDQTLPGSETQCVSWDGAAKEGMSKDKEFNNYMAMSKSLYVIAPRGAGVSTHRTWQALYSGAVPIVPHGPLDSIYEGLPVMLVNEEDYAGLGSSAEKIEELRTLFTEKYQPMFNDDAVQARLNRIYYFEKIETARVEELDKIGLSNWGEERNQCWGYKS
ncbi:hypothetical protein TrST_g9453 [Triparma strigata]|uniref:Exostosin GT47 domain-containing protein n=1 Tax=Triparma strigata TaxID=1606541 RepID=A0A9W7EES1_9STRA|nr:hypothetical protein TrST_g9453 [Triparma strigata]